MITPGRPPVAHLMLDFSDSSLSAPDWGIQQFNSDLSGFKGKWSYKKK